MPGPGWLEEAPTPGPSVSRSGRERAASDSARSTLHAGDMTTPSFTRTEPQSFTTTDRPTTEPSASSDEPGDPRVARQIVTLIRSHGANREGQSRFEIRLDPPELGRVDVALDVSDRQTRVSLVADRWLTTDLLRRNADILVQQLRDSGFSTLDLNFSERRGGAATAQPHPDNVAGELEVTLPPKEPARDSDTGSAASRARLAGLDLRV